MFFPIQISDIINLLNERNVYLYHACNLVDFLSYVNVGGIPSRHLLEAKNQPFTRFDTDDNDRANGVWDKVFVNLTDFGSPFAKGKAWPPVAYGPILFRIYPTALSEASDLAICLRSAGGVGFNRDKETLNSIEDVDKLFLCPKTVQMSNRSFVKFPSKLKVDFGFPDATNPELSLSTANGFIPLSYVCEITVDPIFANGQYLHEVVSDCLTRNNVVLPVIERAYSDPTRREVLAELCARLVEGEATLEEIIQNPASSPTLTSWAESVKRAQLGFQFDRYVKYVRAGTIDPMILGNASEEEVEKFDWNVIVEMETSTMAEYYNNIHDSLEAAGVPADEADDLAYQRLREIYSERIPNFDDWWPEVCKRL